MLILNFSQNIEDEKKNMSIIIFRILQWSRTWRPSYLDLLKDFLETPSQFFYNVIKDTKIFYLSLKFAGYTFVYWPLVQDYLTRKGGWIGY